MVPNIILCKYALHIRIYNINILFRYRQIATFYDSYILVLLYLYRIFRRLLQLFENIVFIFIVIVDVL